MLRRYLRCAVVLFACTGGMSVAQEWSVDAAGGIAVAKRHTLKELRDQYVVKQELDYSCGAAALATLMRYYYGDDTSEREMLDLMNVRLRSLPRAELLRKQQSGFSLLDLQIVAEQKGYKAAGFILSVDQLRKLVAPVMVYVRPLGYQHFAILRGIAGDRVLLADPARGNLSMSTSRFEEEYGGVILALGRKGEQAIESHRLDFRTSVQYAAPEKERVVHRLDSFGRAASRAFR
ncbi:MAG: C39 family peptidase [Gammaproteobacteria bacterium]